MKKKSNCGGARQPTKILEQRGSKYAKDRQGEPKPPEGRPRRPDWLTEAGEIVWEETCEELESMGLMHKTDGRSIGRYARDFELWLQFDLFIQEHGISYPLLDKEGEIKCYMQFPEVAQRGKMDKQMKDFENAFGLTPVARSRIQVTPPKLPEPTGKARFFQKRDGDLN